MAPTAYRDRSSTYQLGSILDFPEPLSALKSGPSLVRAGATTQVDWRETPEAHIFKADLPGMKKEDMKVLVVDGTLEISGERKKEEVQKGDTWHSDERFQGDFMRRFRLPENANMHEVKAHVADGVLTVTVPKVQKPDQKVIQIELA
ncbi:hypothetical protein KC19_2G100100 [Ceratodon purpureus]|nr:hypothetical protein KC19_2G100100 [Ceratodon purpureus]KAG0586561.1 hypothetical protein KC19_2G100100 [Ceratodon purpureus]